MTSPVDVNVEWKRQIELTPGAKYVALSRFDQKSIWEGDRWSVILDFFPSESGAGIRTTARFVTDEAPWELLKTGARFELFEGPTVSAVVTVK